MVYEEANCSYRLLTDTPIYATAIASEDVSESIVKSRLDLTIKNIIKGSGCTDYKLFVSGGNNFRYDIDPTYKANRTGTDPKWREALRLHLIKEWGAYECVGFEADDMCGIEQKEDGSTCIVAIDKDLLQVPGLHYSWPITRKGIIVRQAMFTEISKEEGMKRFFTQALTGDVSDNIKGIHGIGTKKAEKLLAEYNTEEEMYVVVENCYRQVIQDEYKNTDMVLYVKALRKQFERLETNLNLLWIWRELGVTYSVRKEIYG